ncbi:dihydrodipicolinate synthase family protein [Changpingibacter yushuensis]|uniref:dihydrodipicolinate synthase family protein n=1 Tax=Changpingibacter yushuensis TaxID=2758440 RepID=UPI0015F3B05D|nr:dihydrodipicolinate synthase family protein [Changpingibacter yushuensis]
MSQNSPFFGVIPPVVTPLTPERELDVEALEKNVNRMIEAGVNGLFFLGSSGEVVFSTDERRGQILEAGIRATAGRVPVFAGVIDMQTERMIEHAKQAQKLGADAIVATAPFYALGGDVEIEANFRAIREAVDLPLFAYDIPVCVHKKLGVDLLVKLGKEGVLSGVKDSSGDDVAFRFLIRANDQAGHPLQLLTGHEVVVDGAYLGGADGSVPGLANVDPAPYVEQWKAAQEGDWNRVSELQDYLADLMRITSVVKGVQGFGGGVGAFKTALWLLGIYSSNQMPRPVSALEGENVEAVRSVLADLGLVES